MPRRSPLRVELESRSAPVDRLVVPLLAVVLAAAVLAVLVQARPPATVDHVTIRNPYQWNANVDVSSGRGGIVALTTVGRQHTTRVDDVVDQGERWVFQFNYGGVDGGRLVVTRSQLVRAGWTITVPPAFSAAMQAAGVSPSA